MIRSRIRQGQMIWNADEESAKVDAMTARIGETFTATVDCPWCGRMAVHWLDEPRFPELDSGPAVRGLRMINDSIAAMSLYAGGPPRSQYDHPGTVVARVCVACGYRWGQQ